MTQPITGCNGCNRLIPDRPRREYAAARQPHGQKPRKLGKLAMLGFQHLSRVLASEAEELATRPVTDTTGIPHA